MVSQEEQLTLAELEEELFEDNPAEYIHRDLEPAGGEPFAPVSCALCRNAALPRREPQLTVYRQRDETASSVRLYQGVDGELFGRSHGYRQRVHYAVFASTSILSAFANLPF